MQRNVILCRMLELGKGLGALLLGGLLTAGCRDRQQAPAPRPTPEVLTLELTPRKLTLSRELPGRTSPYLIAEIRPQVSGLVRQRLFTEGGDVKAGDVLYEIDPSSYQAAWANAKAALAAAKGRHASAVAAKSGAQAAEASARANVAGAKAGRATALAAQKATQAALAAAEAARLQAEANAVPLRLRVARFRELVADKAVSQQDYDDAAAALKQAEAGIASAEASVQGAEAEVGRAEAAILVADAEIQNADARVQVAEAEIRNAEAAVQSAEAAIGSAEAGLETARINLGYTKITAPISGRIGRSAITTGALVTAHQPAALATIQQLDPIYVDVPQATAELLRMQRRLADGRLSHNGTRSAVKLLLEDGSGYPARGTLQFRDVSVDPTTGSFILRMVFPNPDRTLLPGMFVRAVVEEGVKDDAILVPQQAVSRTPKGDPLAMLVDPSGKVRQQRLVLDQAIGNEWLVSFGLAPGDHLIVEGLQRVRPGATVKEVVSRPDADAPTETKQQAN